MKIWVYFHLQTTSVFHFITLLVSHQSRQACLPLSKLCMELNYSKFIFQMKILDLLRFFIFLKRLGCFPNAIITYIILLPYSSVASAETCLKIETQTTKIIYAYYNDTRSVPNYKSLLLFWFIHFAMYLDILFI